MIIEWHVGASTAFTAWALGLGLKGFLGSKRFRVQRLVIGVEGLRSVVSVAWTILDILLWFPRFYRLSGRPYMGSSLGLGAFGVLVERIRILRTTRPYKP